MLKYNITRKKWADKTTTQFQFKANNNKIYEVNEIRNSIIYVIKSKGYLLGFYYLVFWKNYLKKKNT